MALTEKYKTNTKSLTGKPLSESPERKIPAKSSQSRFPTESGTIKGYFTAEGYMGLVNGSYKLFSCESDYFEYIRE